MGDLIIKGIGDDLLERYRTKAELSGMSLDEALRDGLERAAPLTSSQILELGRRIRAMTPEGIVQTDSTLLLREDRDSR